MSLRGKLASAAWFAFVIGVFAWTSWSYVNTPDESLAHEVLIRHSLVMFYASAPVGYVLALAVELLMDVLGVELVGIGAAVPVSVALGLGGWLQWVVLCPWVVKNLKRKLASSRQ